MPAVAKRNVDLVLCLDTLGQGRPFTEAEKKAAVEWAAWLGRSLEELELKHVTEDWDVLYSTQQKNAERLTVLEEKKGEYQSSTFRCGCACLLRDVGSVGRWLTPRSGWRACSTPRP